MHLKLTISAVLIFGIIIAHPQSSWRIDKLTISDGLSQGYIYAIHQDKKGFIWIGTHGGLNRYDGYNFKVFQYMPFNPSSLGDNSVFFLKEDPVTNKFWIGGSSSLNEFDPETFVNTRYRYSDKQMEFSDGVFINNNEILLACEYGVLVFNTKSKTFFKIPVIDESNKEVSISRVENTAVDRNGNYMIMSKTGIFFFDPGTRTCKRKTESSPDFSPFYEHGIFNVLHDSKGNYWFATNKKGLIRFHPQTKKIYTLPLPSPLKNETVRFDVVMEDKQSNIWAGSSNGLFKINPVTLEVEHFTSDKTKGVSLSHPEINVIREDNNHFMWIGTVGGGINKMIPQNAGFKNFPLSNDIGGNSTGTYIMAIQQVGNDIWFTNIWDQLGKVELGTGKITIVSKAKLPSGYSWYSEGAVLKNENNKPIILNGENMYQVSETSPAISITSKPAPGLSHIHHATNGHSYYMVKAAVAETYLRNDTIYGNQFFFDAKDDTSGNLWIGSSKGLIKLETKTKKVTQFQHDENNSNSISSDFIYALEIDNSNENIWMAAYHGGLCSYNIQTGSFRHYTKDDGLADNIVYSMEKDHRGNLWFSTNAGISTYDLANKIFRNYGKTDGILNPEFNRRSSFKNEEGWIFFGGIFGIDYFHPDSILKKKSIPHLAFTNFRVFNKDYIPDNKKSIQQLDLNHKERFISVEFAALDYNDPQKIQYAYRLNDSKEWIKLGNQHTLSFSDWTVGTHNLFVRSTNIEGFWMDNEIGCSIIIHPPWWQTLWFRFLAIAATAAVIILVIREYFHRKLQQQRNDLEKQQAVEKERTRIATDMHDDLGAGLSRVRFLSETIGMKEQQQLPIEEEITSIRQYSHDMINKMGEIVWALNERNDSLSDLLAYTRSYAVEYLMQNGINCEVEAPEDFPSSFVSGEFRRNIYLVVKEALHNIVKHSQANQVTIRISIRDGLTIRIHDNGIGIDAKNSRPFSNGIINMQKRMISVGGTLDIKNEQGTTIRLSVPLS